MNNTVCKCGAVISCNWRSVVYTGVTNMTPFIVDLEGLSTLATGSLTSTKGIASAAAVRGEYTNE